MIRKGIKSAALFFLLGLTAWFVVKRITLFSHITVPHTIVLTSQSIYSEKLPDDVYRWMSTQIETEKFKSTGKTQLAHDLMQKFPLVERVSWGFYKPGVLYAHVTGVQPRFFINENIIAGSNGKLYGPESFTQYPGSLTEVFVSQQWLNEKNFPGVYRFLESLPEAFFGKFDLMYRDPYTVIVMPKRTEELPYSLLCIIDEKSADLLPSPSVLARLCEEVKKQKRDQWRTGSSFLFDLRFDKRIISRIISLGERETLVNKQAGSELEITPGGARKQRGAA